MMRRHLSLLSPYYLTNGQYQDSKDKIMSQYCGSRLIKLFTNLTFSNNGHKVKIGVGSNIMLMEPSFNVWI